MMFERSVACAAYAGAAQVQLRRESDAVPVDLGSFTHTCERQDGLLLSKTRRPYRASSESTGDLLLVCKR